LAVKRLGSKSHSFDIVEASLFEGINRSKINRGRISDDSVYVTVYEDVSRSELPDYHGPESTARHLDFSYRQVDSG
jgi:hypothetical protein